jgi:hypothetical protein
MLNNNFSIEDDDVITYEENDLIDEYNVIENIDFIVDNFNGNIVELKESVLESEIEILELQLQETENEINQHEIKCKMEEEENKELNKLMSSYQVKVDTLRKYCEKEFIDYQKKNIQYVMNQLAILNKSSNNIISELDLNVKQFSNTNKILVGYKKIENVEFNKIINWIENLISKFEQILIHFVNKSSDPDNILTDLNIEKFQKLFDKLDNVKHM